MTDQNESIARLDTVAAALVARARPTIYRITNDRADVEAAQRLRGRAVLEQGWARPDELPDGREVDVDDDRAAHILAILDTEPIGTCRLFYPEPGRVLPMEQAPGVTRLPKVCVELGRMVVIHAVERERRSVLAGLIGAAWLELRARGHARVCGTASTPMLRLYRRLGFVLHIVGPPVTTFGEERYPILFEPNPETAAVAAARNSTAPG